jgi:hypothetical protein
MRSALAEMCLGGGVHLVSEVLTAVTCLSV